MTTKNGPTPTASGGRAPNRSATASYVPRCASSTARAAARLSPRRKLYARYVLDYVNMLGGRVFFDSGKYRDLRDSYHLDKHCVRLAVDDLYDLGLVDVRLAGNLEVVTALIKDMEDAE